MKVQIAALAALAGVLWPCYLSAAPKDAAPQVVRVVPADGAVDVAVTTARLLVEFDRDMDVRGASFVGGGPTFPPPAGRPNWLDKRTCTLPVKLQPDHYYTFGLNGGRFRNFRSTAGVALEPRTVAFATAPPSSKAALTDKANRAAVAALSAALKSRYSYRDIHRADWEALFRTFGPRLRACKSRSSFALLAGRMLGAARDIHIWLVVGDQTIPTFRRSVRTNFSQAMLVKRLVKPVPQSRAVVWGIVKDSSPKVGYMVIGTWVGPTETTAGAAIEALRKLQVAGAERLIVDVRPNSGGNEYSAKSFAGCFVDKPVIYAASMVVDPRIRGGFDGPITRSLKPNAGGPKFRGRLTVLTGPANMSACEGFLLMMKQVRGCVLVGERTYGASGNPEPVDLGNGVTVYLPTWKAMTPEGKYFEGKGIAPDVEVKTTGADLAGGKDPVLDKALEILGK